MCLCPVATGLWMLVLEWLDHFDHTLDCLSVSPGLVPCTTQELKSCPVLLVVMPVQPGELVKT